MAAGLVDDGAQVLEFAVRAVGDGAAASAAAAPVVGVNGELAGQEAGQPGVQGLGERADVDEDNGRAVAGLLVGDSGAVGGGELRHGVWSFQVGCGRAFRRRRTG
jgi:hypothetical protein